MQQAYYIRRYNQGRSELKNKPKARYNSCLYYFSYDFNVFVVNERSVQFTIVEAYHISQRSSQSIVRIQHFGHCGVRYQMSG